MQDRAALPEALARACRRAARWHRTLRGMVPYCCGDAGEATGAQTKCDCENRHCGQVTASYELSYDPPMAISQASLGGLLSCVTTASSSCFGCHQGHQGHLGHRDVRQTSLVAHGCGGSYESARARFCCGWQPTRSSTPCGRSVQGKGVPTWYVGGWADTVNTTIAPAATTTIQHSCAIPWAAHSRPQCKTR